MAEPSSANSQAMSKFERVGCAARGQATDRCPFSFWTHLPEVDLDAEKLAETTASFAREFDVDFVKSMPNGMYMIEDFGCEIDFSAVANRGVAKVVSTPVAVPADWDRVEILPPETGALGRELKSLKLLQDRVGADFPVVFTVFSPLTIAQKVSGGKALAWIREGAETGRLHRALDAIAKTVSGVCARAIEIGAAGVFFATQVTGKDELSAEQYVEFAARHDMTALEGAQGGWFNILHLHGSDVRFDETRDYPVHALNWHVWETPPSIAEARTKTDKCLVGGIDRRRVWEDDRQAIATQIAASWDQAGKGGIVVTPGCVIRPPLDRDFLAFIRQTVHGL